jgi:hypothetical protein
VGAERLQSEGVGGEKDKEVGGERRRRNLNLKMEDLSIWIRFQETQQGEKPRHVVRWLKKGVRGMMR